jgi:23S rRNA (guanosine2251-2'-O)-methyltransferase
MRERRRARRGPPPDDRNRRVHGPKPAPSRQADHGQVEGRRAALEAVRAGAEVRRLRVAEGAETSATVRKLLDEAKARHLLVERVPTDVIDAQSQTGRHQGVIAEVRLPTPLSLEDLLARAREGGREPFLVVLDGIEDPQNVGAIARSAEAAGAHGLVLPERRSAGISPGSLRASAGALILLPVAEVRNVARALESLKAQGVWIAGADPSGGKPYHEASLSGPIALVIGGEARGLHRLVRDRCDFLVSVPLRGRIESLNASAAAAVLMFEIARQRDRTKPHSENPK